MSKILSRDNFINEVYTKRYSNNVNEGFFEFLKGLLKKQGWDDVKCSNEMIKSKLEELDNKLNGFTLTKMQYPEKCQNVRQGLVMFAETLYAAKQEEYEQHKKLEDILFNVSQKDEVSDKDKKNVAMREMILADSAEGRKNALDKLLPYQKADFKGILEAMDGCPVNIRLLDPPLHEFVPHDRAGQEVMAKQMGVDVSAIKRRVESLAENNPMLGHRGCRLGITFPEITAMQTRAILSAACELKKEGKNPMPEIMVPLIGTLNEFKQQKGVILKAADEVFEEYGEKIDFEIGTMIEIPRAALIADRIAEEAEYFSFGTNDLTQMTFGYSRDDIASFLPVYLEKKILKVDPFQVLDQAGVGQLVKMAVEKGRAVRPNLLTGICGEHGGEPSSVKFCAKIGLNYASCSPFRVPIARLAAAQAAVEE